jgi:hypothetical protein
MQSRFGRAFGLLCAIALVSKALVWGPWWFPYPGSTSGFGTFLAEGRHFKEQIARFEAEYADQLDDRFTAGLYRRTIRQYRWAQAKLGGSVAVAFLLISVPIIRARKQRATPRP